MKQKLLGTCLKAYLFFIAGSFLAAFFLTPKLLRRSLYAISDDEVYRAYLATHSIAIQNVCYFLLILVLFLSLIPAAMFMVKLYRPLNRIILAASQYTDGNSHPPIPYNANDELGRLTASINYLAESVSSSEEYQRKFISNISHDFRSPLTSIKGYVEAILDGTIPPEMQERYLNIVLSETERLNKLTEGLLLLNTLDDNGTYLEMTDFDIVSVIRSTMEAFEGTCRKKNLHILSAFSSDSVMVHADMGKIQQVLYNLIDNAIKFSYTGSEILITVHEQNNSVFVSVKDKGEGIAKENLSRIWDRFYKTDASRGRDKKGTGLGLSIVKEIIRAHNQNINVISTEGVGTEFIFTLNRA
ncbi:MAG: HAMP domain-containing sensor histidine kinase [Candidatus Choladocola sp.]|nr:HAMP domain-containing sensor histidine kinase [Candidatus Choladocola sp.]